ncbi:hypothetical Protein YC6258_03060 [Gynuella sunshinyii YC6258]|uniref:Uncharacterized protein n=1 Tax=Gynuella sunshinyii YC6258 TaxID=1445510 RepID=A0A0C5VLB6_9GAMM|nr:hypothetical Protein YC6258_03060 [Gynuella sunshinyii YC6258]
MTNFCNNFNKDKGASFYWKTNKNPPKVWKKRILFLID